MLYLKQFLSKNDMKFDLLSDFKCETSAAYGVLRPDTIFSNRAYFLIGTTGITNWSCVQATPGTKRENAEILDALLASTVRRKLRCGS